MTGPELDPPLHRLSLLTAAERIAAGTLSPVKLVQALLDRAATLDPELRVWVMLDAEGAVSAAEAREQEAATRRLRGPLHGVPIGVKDIYHVAGVPTRSGSRWYHHVPDRDAETVGRLRSGGAIILGKTHTTEFAMADPSPCRNPWNLAHTPGGSSSGSAAGVAAGLAPAALGTQTAGSVLRPAAFCGIVGFKSTYDRLSRDGILPLAWTLDHPGTLTRSVADTALLFSVMAPDARPVRSLGAPPRIGLVGDVFPERLNAAGHDALHAAASRFEAAGAKLVELALPSGFDATLDVHHVIMLSEIAAAHRATFAAHADEYGPRLRQAVEAGSLVPAAAYLRAQQARRALRRAMLPLFDGVECLLVPSAPGSAPSGLQSTGDPSFNAPWSLLGLPAISLPAGLDPEGMPLGVQLVAAPWQDERLLEVASWCERALEAAPLAPQMR